MPKEIFSETHRIVLRDVSGYNLIELLKLEVAENQKPYVAPNPVSVAQAHYEPNAWLKGIYHEDTPVGLMLCDFNVEAAEFFLWRLMIDQHYQNQGFGKEAIELLIQYLIDTYQATELKVSCVPGDEGPLNFYKKMGFIETGAFVEDESLLVLDLAAFSADAHVQDSHHDHLHAEDEPEWEEVDLTFAEVLQSEDDLWILYDHLNWNGYLNLDVKDLNAAMNNSYKVLYAYAGTQLVGTGRLISDGYTNAYLCGVGVLETFRGQGIGTALSKNLIQYAKGRGLTVQLFCEDHLVPFYEALGCKTFAIGMKTDRTL